VQWRDVEYRPGLLARIYRPQGDGPFPVLLEIHGGGWNNADRTQNAPLAESLAANGLLVVSVDFRLAGQAAYPASIADVNYATRWVKHHAAEFGGTAEGLGALGLSSGGHMAMLSAMRPRDPRYAALALDADPAVDASLTYVMLGWPVLDPHALYVHARGQGKTELLELHHRYFGDEDTMCEANPQQILERGEPVELPPALIFVAADDDVLSPRTAERFVEAYGQAGGTIELAKFPRGGHGYSRQGGPLALRTADVLNSFVERQLKAFANHW
jgi:acetyl esterase/lipase